MVAAASILLGFLAGGIGGASRLIGGRTKRGYDARLKRIEASNTRGRTMRAQP